MRLLVQRLTSIWSRFKSSFFRGHFYHDSCVLHVKDALAATAYAWEHAPSGVGAAVA